MAKTAKIQLPSRAGTPLNVYARVTDDGAMVSVWTKHQNIGLYRIERFTDSTLSAASLRTLLTRKD